MNVKTLLTTLLVLYAMSPLSSDAVQIVKLGPGVTGGGGVEVVDGIAVLQRLEANGLSRFFEVRSDNSLELLYAEDESIRGSRIAAVENGNAVVFASTGQRAFYWVPRAGSPQRISPPLLNIPSRTVAIHDGRVLFFGISNIGEALYAWPIGSASTAGLVADLRSDNLISSAATFLGRAGNRVLFVGFADTNSLRLWITDGTPSGTALVPLDAQIAMISGSGDAVSAECTDKVLTGGWINGSAGIIASNGTAAGTTIVAPYDGDYPRNMRQFSDDKVVVLTRTARVVDCGGGPPITLSPPNIAGVSGLARLPQGVLFSALVPGLSNTETLWFGPGDRLSAQVRADVFMEPPPSHRPNRIGRLGSTAYFSGTTDVGAVRRFELWQTDGTAEGTIRTPGAAEVVSPGGFSNDWSGALFFMTRDGSWVIRPDAAAVNMSAVPTFSTLGVILLISITSIFAMLSLSSNSRGGK